MTPHACPRCGYQTTCSHGSWPDRHPISATVGGLFTLVFMGMMFSVHPVAAAVMTVLAAAWFGARAVGRERARRAALAARADYEHAALMTRSVPPVMRFPRQPLPPDPDSFAPRHVMNRWPTTPMSTLKCDYVPRG